jgi:antirestriction protein ArdC
MGRIASVSRSASSSASQAGDGPRLSPAERVTAQIANLLKRGVRPWVKPWDDGGSGLPLELPLRACGTAYRGMNIVALWAAAMERGFQARHWFTFKQALALEACVRKGERGSFVVFYTELAAKDGEAAPREDQDGADLRRILRGYTVFNAEQIDRLPPQFHAPVPVQRAPVTDREDARFAGLFARVPALVREDGTRAFYSMAADVIQMPPKAAFTDRTQFWATLAHELSHWTRHPTRLDRDFGQTRFGDLAYALEELVAELSAAFIGAQIGLPADHIEDHAAYIDSWLKALSYNPSAFLTAAGKAQAAADWVLREMGVGSPVAVD